MQVELEKTSSVLCKLSVTIPATDVDAAFNHVYREVGKTAKVPGFRPGKVPRGILEAHYGARVKGEVESRLINQSLVEAMTEKDVAPVASPKVEPGALSKGAEFSYTAEIEIQPKIELKMYKGLEVPPLDASIDSKAVELELEAIRHQAAQLVPVLDRDVVQEGDVVVLDYVGTMGGVPFEGGAAEGAVVEVGGGGYIPGFTEGLVGAKVPSQRQVEVTFPENYKAENLAGKPATFAMSLKELKKKDVPPLDDELAKDVGEEDLASLRQKVEGQLQEKRQKEAEKERRRALLEALVAANPFEVPPSMVAEQTDQMIAGAAAQIQMMMGQRFNLSDLEIDNLREETRKDAEMQVRSGLLLLEVAKQEKIEVDDAAVDAEIDEMAKNAGEQKQRLLAYYQDPQQRSRLRYHLLEDKTVDFLFTNSMPSAAGDSTESAGAEADSAEADGADADSAESEK